MIPGDLAAEIIAGVVAILAVMFAIGCRRSGPAPKIAGPGEAPKEAAAAVADAGRANADEVKAAGEDAIADAMADEHPATALAHLVNADRRGRR